MHEVRMNIARASKAKQDIETIRLKALEEELKD